MEIGLLIDSAIIKKQHKVEDYSSVEVPKRAYKMGNKASLKIPKLK